MAIEHAACQTCSHDRNADVACCVFNMVAGCVITLTVCRNDSQGQGEGGGGDSLADDSEASQWSDSRSRDHDTRMHEQGQDSFFGHDDATSRDQTNGDDETEEQADQGEFADMLKR